jgi:uncharacterized peroxidase-related enzyme
MMTILQTLTDLSPETQEIFRQTTQKKGFVPHVLAVYGPRPELLDGIVGISGGFGAGQLNEVEREIVLLTTSVSNQCRYCVAGHSYYAIAAGLDEESVRRLRLASPLDDPGREALRLFSQTLAQGRGHDASTALENFRRQGFSRSQALDIIVGVAAKTLSNMTATLLDLPLDDAFKPYAWSPA